MKALLDAFAALWISILAWIVIGGTFGAIAMLAYLTFKPHPGYFAFGVASILVTVWAWGRVKEVA
jgi:hypothetical protein